MNFYRAGKLDFQSFILFGVIHHKSPYFRSGSRLSILFTLVIQTRRLTTTWSHNNIDTGNTRGSDLDHLSINGTSNILETLRWSMTFSNEWKGWWSKQRARGLSSEGTFYNSMKFDTDWTERDTCEWTKYVWIIVVTSMCSLSIESRIVSSW